jgi:hypothetical protein
LHIDGFRRDVEIVGGEDAISSLPRQPGRSGWLTIQCRKDRKREFAAIAAAKLNALAIEVQVGG